MHTTLIRTFRQDKNVHMHARLLEMGEHVPHYTLCKGLSINDVTPEVGEEGKYKKCLTREFS